MKHLWVVYGRAGEYDDRRDWEVCAYPTEELARAHAALAQTRANELFCKYRGRDKIPEKANRYDEAMTIYDYDVQYGVFQLEVRVELPSP